MSSTARNTQQVQDDLRRLVSDIESVLASVSSDAPAAMQQARQRFGATIDDARRRLGVLDTQVREGARSAAQASDRLVHERPWPVLGAAALIGLLAGILIARR